jgi:hypothetical protein
MLKYIAEFNFHLFTFIKLWPLEIKNSVYDITVGCAILKELGDLSLAE